MKSPIRTEVDGIPLLWVEDEKPLKAALMFRVGRSDETLRTCGVTHIVEHLAVSTVGKRPHPYNAFVDGTRTVFWAAGREDEVGRFLSDISKALSALPLARMATEKRVLIAEAQSRRTNFVTDLFNARYGASGFGLLGAAEFGVWWLPQESISAWAAERFTAGNAALWMTGPPPDGLAVELPPGRRLDPIQPEIQPPELEFPSYAVSPDQRWVTSGSWVGGRSGAVAVMQSLVLRRLNDAVRHELGLAYRVTGDSTPLNRDQGHLAFAVESVPDSARKVRDEVLKALHEMSERGPTEEERAHDRELRRRASDYPGAATRHLDWAAAQWLFGDTDVTTPDEVAREAEEVTTEDLTEALRDALKTLMVRGPSGVPPPVEGFKAYPWWSTEGVVGRPFGSVVAKQKWRLSLKAARTPKRDVLYVGAAGVSIITAEGNMATVPYDRCEAVVEGPDGWREIWARDGIHIKVEPSKWEQGSDAIAAIDRSRPPELVVRAPAADPEGQA